MSEPKAVVVRQVPAIPVSVEGPKAIKVSVGTGVSAATVESAGAEMVAHKNEPGGYAGLTSESKIPLSEIPAPNAGGHYETSFGDGVHSSFTITHNLHTPTPAVTVVNQSTGLKEGCAIRDVNENTVELSATAWVAAPPGVAAYRVSVDASSGLVASNGSVLTGYAQKSEVGANNGIAPLNSEGDLPAERLPIFAPAEQGHAQANIGILDEGYIRPLQSAATIAQQEAFGNGESKPLSSYYSSLSEAQAHYSFVTSLSQQLDWAIIQKAANLIAATGTPVGGKIALPSRASFVTADMLSFGQCVAVESEGGGMFSCAIVPTSTFGSYSTSPAVIQASGPASGYTLEAFRFKGIEINALNIPASVKYAIQLLRPYDLTRLERINFTNLPHTLQALWAGPNPSLSGGVGEFMVLDQVTATTKSYAPSSVGTLSGALTAGTAISSLTLSSGLASTLPAGNILIESAAGGPHGQVFYTPGAEAGATTIPVEASDDFPSLVPIYSFAGGSVVTPIGVPLFHLEKIIETRLRSVRVLGETGASGPYWNIGYNFLNCRSILGDIEAHGIPVGMLWQVNESSWVQAGQAAYFEAPVMEGVAYPATITGTSSVKAASVYWLGQRSANTSEISPYNATGPVQLYQVQNSVIDVSNNTNTTAVYADSTVTGCEITVSEISKASISGGVGLLKSRTGQVKIYNDDGTKTSLSLVGAPAGMSNNYLTAETNGGTLVFAIDSTGKFKTASANEVTTATEGSVTPPAKVVGYIEFLDHSGTTRKIPYYAS